MSERTERDEERFIIDDTDDDVAAAWREVSAGNSASGDWQEAPTSRDAGAETEATETPAELQPSTREDGRDERGRYARRAGAEENTQEAPGKPEEQPGEQPVNVDAPPPSWGVKAKAAWQNLPPDVRQEIGKREGEVAQGLRALADYKDLKPYAEAARQYGTTIRGALDHYIAVDRLCQRDLAGGLAVAAESYQKDRGALAQMFLGLAQRYGANVQGGAQAQPGQQLGEDDALLQILAPVINPLKSQLDELRQSQMARLEADRNAQVQSLASEIQRFSADPKNVYFANVEADIIRLFQGGVVPQSGNPAADLQAAYDMAVRMNPEIQEALIEQRIQERQAATRQQEQEKAAKARNASRSMGGSRVPGLLYKEEKASDHEPDDIEADVRRAYRASIGA